MVVDGLTPVWSVIVPSLAISWVTSPRLPNTLSFWWTDSIHMQAPMPHCNVPTGLTDTGVLKLKARFNAYLSWSWPNPFKNTTKVTGDSGGRSLQYRLLVLQLPVRHAGLLLPLPVHFLCALINPDHVGWISMVLHMLLWCLNPVKFFSG